MTPNVTHEPALAATGAVIAAYCIYTLPDGTRDFVVMSRAELDAIRGKSNAWKAFLKDNSKKCPYNTDPEEMDKKTVIKRAMKLFEGASVELTIILEADHRAMGFADYNETNEPITMPKAMETTATTEESRKQADNGDVKPPAAPPSVTVIPATWIMGKDSKGKSIPHPHAGRSIKDLKDGDLTSIMEGLRADPATPGKPKEAKYQPLLDALENELERRIQQAQQPTEG